MAVDMICIAPDCFAPAENLHHCVYQQVIRREKGSVSDPGNLVGICERCHSRHHSRVAPLPLRVLPDSVFVFAAGLMGPWAAYEWLNRFYEGGDPRLDGLLEMAA